MAFKVAASTRGVVWLGGGKGGSVALGQQRYVSDVVTFLREDLVLDT